MKYMTKEWYEKCQIAGRPPFDEEIEREVQEIMDSYYNEYKKSFTTDPNFMETIDILHDCEVVCFKKAGNDYIIRTDNSEWGMDGFTDIVLKNAAILKKEFDDSIKDLIWLYEEMYKTMKGFELHCLFFQCGTGDLFELTTDCENIEISPVK